MIFKASLTKIFFWFISVLIISSANDIRNTTEETISAVFGKSVELEMIVFKIPTEIKSRIENEVKQLFFEEKVYVWKITKDEETIGYAVLDNVYGKSMPITFLVLFNNELQIVNTSVVKYREAYGGAVKNENWNSQFKGKDETSGYKVGSDINGITGATISVNSVSKGIKKLSLLIPRIIEHL